MAAVLGNFYQVRDLKVGADACTQGKGAPVWGRMASCPT